jgi:hypothetical protein
MVSRNYATTISIECRDPGRRFMAEAKPKQKNLRKRKGDPDVG